MPPKDQASKKAIDKKKKSTIEDRTFGLKNKNKSKKVQQYVKAVETSVAFAGQNTKQRREDEKLKAAKEAMKQSKEAMEMEKEALFKAVVNKTVVPAGVDPKSVVCEFFKAGKCVRGNKCRYSHDVEVARKVNKIDLYSDPRALQAQDTIDKWDTDKLAAVVGSKLKGKLPPTDIICKYFLDAIENSHYGWFWECPSGVECHYRHCLPPGFVLKTKAEKDRAKNAEQDEDEEETLEEKIDQQRKALDLSKCTPLTLELFKKWKADKEVRRLAEVQVKREAAEKKAAGSGLGVMSGRDLFTYDPSLFVDDAEADDEQYDVDEEYDPAANGDDDDDDVHAKNYDSQAESADDEEEEQKGEAIDEEDEEDDGEEEEEQKESASASSSSASAASAVPASKATTTKDKAKSKSDAAVDASAAAIDASLFLDEDLPEE